MLSEQQRQEITAKLLAARENLDVAIRLSLTAAQPDLVDISRATRSEVAVGADELRRLTPFAVRELRGDVTPNAVLINRATKTELTVMIDENRRLAPPNARPKEEPEHRQASLHSSLTVTEVPLETKSTALPRIDEDHSARSFGGQLRRERERRGVTLEEISLSTKIRTELLEALERERFQDLPGFFNKSFLRAYARHLGLDEEDTVENYVATFERDPELEEDTAATNSTVSIPFVERLGPLKRVLTWDKVLRAVVLCLIVDLFVALAWGPWHTWQVSGSALAQSTQWRTKLTSQQLLQLTELCLLVALCSVLAWKPRRRRVSSEDMEPTPAEPQSQAGPQSGAAQG